MDESDTKYTKRLLLGAALIFAALVFALIEIETVITGVVVLFLWGWWDRRRMRKLSIQFEFARTYGTAPWADSALGDLEAAGEAVDHHRWSREEYFEKLRQEIANPSPELRGTPEDVLTEMLGPECLFTMGEMRDAARDCRDGKGYDAAALAAYDKVVDYDADTLAYHEKRARNRKQEEAWQALIERKWADEHEKQTKGDADPLEDPEDPGPLFRKR